MQLFFMLLADLLALEPAHVRVQRIARRLIPLHSHDGLASRSRSVRELFAIFELTGEVRNGGIHQYFSNSAGDSWPLALEALQGMQVHAAEAAFRRALAAFAGGAPSTDRSERGVQLDAVDEAALAVADRDLDLAHQAVVDALIAHVGKHVPDFEFLDRYPSGLKAVPLPGELTLNDAVFGLPVDRVEAAITDIEQRFEAGEALVPAARTFLLAHRALAPLLKSSLYGYIDSRVASDDEAVEAVRLVGLPASAIAIERILRAFGGRLPADGDALEAILKVWSPEMKRETIAALQDLASHPVIPALETFVREQLADLAKPSIEAAVVVTLAYAAIQSKDAAARDEIESTFLDVFWMLDAVSAYGFESYLFTQAATRYDETCRALRLLGLAKTERLLLDATAVLGSEFSRDLQTRRRRLSSLDTDARERIEAHSREFQAHRYAVIEALAAFLTESVSAVATQARATPPSPVSGSGRAQ